MSKVRFQGRYICMFQRLDFFRIVVQDRSMVCFVWQVANQLALIAIDQSGGWKKMEEACLYSRGRMMPALANTH